MRVSERRLALLKWLGLGLASLLIGVYLFSLTAHNTFTFDEWMFFTDRREFSFHALVSNHNGHLSIVPAAFYIAVFKTLGYANYEVFRLLAVVVHLLVTLLAVDRIRQRHGWAIAVPIGTALALMGGGGENILWGFQIGFMGSLLFFLIALRCYERSLEMTNLAWPLLTMIAVCLSVGCAGTGIGSILVLFFLTIRTLQWKRLWWVSVVPGVMYAAWYVRYAGLDNTHSAVSAVPAFVANSASYSMSAIFGIDHIWGSLMIGVLVAYFIRLIRAHKISRHSLAIPVFVLFFWFATAYGRAFFGHPESSRYLYIGIFGILLSFSENVTSHQWTRVRTAKFVKVGAVTLSALAIWGSHSQMQFWSDIHLSLSQTALGQLSVFEAHRSSIDSATILQSIVVIRQVPLLQAGDYFAAIDAVGSSPVQNVRELVSAPPQTRMAADDILFSFGFARVVGTENEFVNCVSQPESQNLISVEPGGEVNFVVTQEVTATMARFFDLYSRGINDQVLEPGNYVALLKTDTLGGSLHVQFSDSSAVLICE
jgi:hypothetical protein